MEPTQELQGGSAAMRKRTALVTLGGMQAGLGSLDTMPSVPLGGLEMNVTQVLQPVSPTTKHRAPGIRGIQQLRKIGRVFLAEVTPSDTSGQAAILGEMYSTPKLGLQLPSADGSNGRWAPEDGRYADLIWARRFRGWRV